MNNTMKYKNYVGSIEFSEEDELFYGRVLGINTLISYEGQSAKDLLADFHEAVDDYLKFCETNSSIPETPYKGSLNIRLKPQTHRDAALFAIHNNMSLNSLIEVSVSTYLSSQA